MLGRRDSCPLAVAAATAACLRAWSPATNRHSGGCWRGVGTHAAALPETGVTVYSGDMGDTLPPRRGHALEGVSRGGRASPVRRPPARRREDGARSAPSSGSRGRPATRSTTGTRTAACTALTDRSRRPYRHANQLPLVVEKAIVRLKREYPTGARRRFASGCGSAVRSVQCPAISTVHAVLDRHGLVTRRGRRRPRLDGHRPVAARSSRMRSGVRTTRASSCSPIGGTAIR